MAVNLQSWDLTIALWAAVVVHEAPPTQTPVTFPVLKQNILEMAFLPQTS